MNYPVMIGPLTLYGWGWDLQLFPRPWAWWLVSSSSGLYISENATPPEPPTEISVEGSLRIRHTRGVWLRRGIDR